MKCERTFRLWRYAKYIYSKCFFYCRHNTVSINKSSFCRHSTASINKSSRSNEPWLTPPTVRNWGSSEFLRGRACCLLNNYHKEGGAAVKSCFPWSQLHCLSGSGGGPWNSFRRRCVWTLTSTGIQRASVKIGEGVPGKKNFCAFNILTNPTL